MSGHRELLAWREAMQLARMVYEATDGFPRAERFGLTLQLRRAAVSAEVDTQLELATTLGWLQGAAALKSQHSRVGQLTGKLRQSISRAPLAGHRTTNNEQRTTNNGQRR